MVDENEAKTHEIKISMYDKILVTVDYDGMYKTTTEFYISGLHSTTGGHKNECTSEWELKNLPYPKE